MYRCNCRGDYFINTYVVIKVKFIRSKIISDIELYAN